MIPQEFDYSAPATVEEALELLRSPEAKALAGGMSLVPLMKLRLAAPERLVDLGRVTNLSYIREDAGRIRIGAMTTHYQVEASALVRSRCPLLAEAAAHIGDVQVRNMGTIGGSLAHADPAADYPASLFALGAEVKLARAGASRTLAIGDFLQDTFTTALEPGELIVEVSVPVEEAGAGVSYQKMVQPASGFAIVGVAARVRREGDKVATARVGVTGLGPKPFRAEGVEKLLEGTAGSDGDVARAVAGIAEGVQANADIHASAAYRARMARVYATRAIRQALSRAR
jgi:carbon-monoxide dehydrogenase medium subunit